MIEILITILFEVIYLMVLVSTGAFIRWLFSNRKRKLGDFMEDKQFLNAVIGAVAIFGVMFLLIPLLN